MKRCCWDSIRGLATSRIVELIDRGDLADSIEQNSIRCGCFQVIIVRQASTIDLVGIPVQERLDAEQFSVDHLESK